jgi:hypothetical protein
MIFAAAERPLRAGLGAAFLACGLVGLLAATGCSSSSAPSWASVLGPGVTVQAPAKVAPGYGSPGAVIEGVLSALVAEHDAAECAYAEPSRQAACKSAFSSMPRGTAGSFDNASIGYVAIDGDVALVGSTGTSCSPLAKPECYTNNNPAAIFSSNKKSFSGLWTEENSSGSSANVYMLAPCIKVNGKWYLYLPS